VHRDDVRVVDLGEDPLLLQQPTNDVVIMRPVVAQHLDRELPVVADPVPFVHPPRRAAAEHRSQQIPGSQRLFHCLPSPRTEH
jgi:hypothetical protein